MPVHKTCVRALGSERQDVSFGERIWCITSAQLVSGVSGQGKRRHATCWPFLLGRERALAVSGGFICVSTTVTKVGACCMVRARGQARHAMAKEGPARMCTFMNTVYPDSQGWVLPHACTHSKICEHEYRFMNIWILISRLPGVGAVTHLHDAQARCSACSASRCLVTCAHWCMRALAQALLCGSS